MTVGRRNVDVMAADLNAHHAKAATRIVDTRSDLWEHNGSYPRLKYLLSSGADEAGRDYDREDTTILLADVEASPLADSGFGVGPAFESIGVSGLSSDQGQDRGLSDSAVRVRRYEDPHYSTEAFIDSLGVYLVKRQDILVTRPLSNLCPSCMSSKAMSLQPAETGL